MTPLASTRAPASRRFGLLDLAIAIAAVAVGLALARAALASEPVAGLRTNPGLGPLVRSAALGLGLTNRAVAVLTVALLVVRLRRPRPPLRRLLREPGATALVAGSAALAFGLLSAVPPALYWNYHYSWIRADTSYWGPIEARVGPAIVAAWAALIVGRRWRARRDALDRAGRVVGAYWIVVLVVLSLVQPALGPMSLPRF